MRKVNSQVVRGFQPVIVIQIINGVYLDIDKTSELFKICDGYECEVSSADSNNELISRATRLKFALPKYDIYEEANRIAESFMMAIRIYLSKKGFAYLKPVKNIHDLSKSYQAEGFDVNIDIKQKRSFDPKEIAGISGEKIEIYIELIEKANIVHDTTLEFLLYMILLDSMAPNEGRPDDVQDGIDKILKCVDKLGVGEEDDRNSIKSAIGGLKNFGSKKAILRMLKQIMPVSPEDFESTTKKVINECYEMRSQYVHGGIMSADIEQYLPKIKEIVYQILEYKN